MRKLIFNPITGCLAVVLAYFGMKEAWTPQSGFGVWLFLAALSVTALVVMFSVAYYTDSTASGGHGVPTEFAASVGLLLFFPLILLLTPVAAGIWYAATHGTLVLPAAVSVIALFSTWGMVVIPTR